MIRRGLRAAVALAVLLGAACGQAGSDETSAQRRSDPRPEPTVESTDRVAPDSNEAFPQRWQPAPLAWNDCPTVPGMQCSTLEVPLDWSDPLGPTVSLAVARRPATGERIGSLITNPGGPGGSGIQFLAYAPFSTTVASRFDLVSWDPRGVGDSTAVTCGAGVSHLQSLDQEPDDASEQQDLEDAAAAVAEECGRLDGDLLPHLGTTQVARDLEALRIALGDEPLTYVGFSYGTHIGQIYAELFGTNIRAMVLDGVVDTAHGFEDFLTGQAIAFEAAFDRNAEACAAAGAAVCGVDDLAEAYDRVMALAEQDQLTAGSTAGPADVVLAAVVTSYVADGWQQLGPALGSALDGGNGAPVLHLADSYRDLAGYPAYAAVVCVDSEPPRGVEDYRDFAQRAAGVAPRFGAAVANELLPCALWPADATPNAAVTAPEAPPILLIGNTGDPATPHENAVAAADRIRSAQLLTVEMEGHIAYGSNLCATEVVDAYLLRLDMPSGTERCT